MFRNVQPLYEFNCSVANNILITSSNIADKACATAFQNHCKQLFVEDEAAAKKYAQQLWKQLVKQKGLGITVDLFFKILLLLKEDLENEKMQLEFCSIIEKSSALRKMVLDLVFTSTTSKPGPNNPEVMLPSPSVIFTPRSHLGSAQYRAKTTMNGILLLRKMLGNSSDIRFAATFFSCCKKSIGSIDGLAGGSLLRPTLRHYRLAQIFLGNQPALIKILDRDIDQNELAILIANAPPPAEIHDVGTKERLLGITLDNDYFSELFAKIFSHPIHLQTLLKSGLLTLAAQNPDYISEIQFQAIERIRQYFYQDLPNPRLAAYLKKYPQVFAQLAGENGEHVVHLCNLSSDPIRMAQFFVSASATRKLFTQHAEDIALHFGEYYSAKHVAKLLTTKSGGHPLFHYHDEDLPSKKRLTLELCVASNDTLWKKCRKIYQQEQKERSVALYNARLAIDQSFKVFRQKPSCMSVEASILIASSDKLWEKISTPRWFEFEWMKKFKQRKKQLLNNPIFFARFQLGKHAAWQEITARLIAVCDGSEGFFKQDPSNLLKQLICCFASPADLEKLIAQHESLKRYATTYFGYKSDVSSQSHSANPANKTPGDSHLSRDNPSLSSSVERCLSDHDPIANLNS